MAVAAGEARRSLPAFLPVSEQEKVQLPLGQAMTGQASTGGETGGSRHDLSRSRIDAELRAFKMFQEVSEVI